VKKGDIVRFKTGIRDNIQEGRVNWVKEGNVGITLIGDGYSGKEATVMLEKECEVMIEFKGDTLKEKIHNMETEELKASIERLKGMRFPKKVVRRASASVAPSKKKKMTRLLELLEENPDALDGLIQKALNEDKEVKE